MNYGPELKPCPFCGKDAELISRKNWGHRIECQWCCVHSPAYRPSKATALDEWNTRSDLCLTQADLDAAVLAERERCGAIAESHNYGFQSSTEADLRASHIAAAIRKGELT
jgi:transcription elongation factor Elf1